MRIIKKIYIFIITIFVTVFYAFVNTLLLLKSSMSISASLVTPLIMYMLFSIIFKPKIKDLIYCQTIATAASTATFGINISYVAVKIFEENSISLNNMIVLVVLGNVFVVFFTSLLSDYILNDKEMIFPKGMATIKLIDSLFGKIDNMKEIYYSSAISIMVTFIVEKFVWIKYPLHYILGTSHFIGVEVSPILMGIGMYINIKNTISMILGVVYTLFIIFIGGYNIKELSYSILISNDYILLISTGLILGSVIYTLPNLFGNIFRFTKEFLSTKSKKINLSNKKIMLLIFCISYIIYLGFILEIKNLGLILMISLSFLLTLGTIKSRGETGISTSAIIYVCIPTISLFTNSFETVLILGGLIVLYAIQGAHFCECTKVNAYFGYKKITFNFFIIGSIIGAIVGMLSIILLEKAYGFGTMDLPSPNSFVWSTNAKMFLETTDISSFNFKFILLGICLGIIVNKIKLSSASVAVGILLPMSTIIPMVIGGIFKHLIESKGWKISTSSISIGLVTGGSIVLLIISMYTLF